MAAGSSVKFTRDFLRCSSRLARIQRNSKSFRRISSVSGDEVVNSGGNCLFVKNLYVVCTWFLYCLKWPKSISTKKIDQKLVSLIPYVSNISLLLSCLLHILPSFMTSTSRKIPCRTTECSSVWRTKKGGFQFPWVQFSGN